MNNIANALNATASLTAAPNATGASATPTPGEAGVFAQLLGSYTPAPAAAVDTPCVARVGADPAVETVAAAIAPAIALQPDAAPQLDPADDAETLPQPDAALVAALLGQMQTPYAMLAPTPVTNTPAPPAAANDPVAAPVSAPLPAALDATTHTPAATAEPDAPVSVDTPAAQPASQTTGAQQPPALSAFALPVPPSAADAEAANDSNSDKPSAPEQRKSSGDNKNTPIPTTAATTAAAAAAAAAAQRPASASVTRPAPEQEARPAPVDDETGSDARPAAGSAASSTEGNGNAGSARSRSPAEFRRMMEVQAMRADGEASADRAAAPVAVATAAAALQPRASGHREAFEPSSDITAVSASAATATPALIAHRGDTAPANVSIAPRLDSPEWKPAFANSVKLLVNDGTTAASLQLNPAEFGPIDVRIVMTDQRADISFAVTHPDANAAIQSALSDLRDQLARSGIQLGQTSVGTQSQQPRQQAATPQRQAPANAAAAPVSGDPPPPRAHGSGSGSGSIDIYA